MINIITYGAGPFLRSRQLCSHSRISQHFMELEGSLSCSQKPSTGLYPEPDKSEPPHPILSLQEPFKYCPPTYSLVFLVISFLLAFPPMFFMQSSSPPFVLHALHNGLNDTTIEEVLMVDCKQFWRWCITLWITRVLDFVHRPVF
jgi:hypothetical protein